MPPSSTIPLPRLVARLLSALAAILPPMTCAQQPALHYSISPALVASALAEHWFVVTPDRIQLPALISSTVADPTLHLLAADLRPDGSLSLRLACRTSAECLPFFAVLATSGQADALTLLSHLRNLAPASPAAGPDTRADRVTVGTHVRLQLSDLQMHIQIEGIALDTGEAGHEVRIASLDRRHTYRGIVVDATTVKGDLP